MKIIKNSIAGLMVLFATNTMANNADIAKNTREQKLQYYTLEASLHQIEQNLIKDYLTEAFQSDITREKENDIKIVDNNGNIVYLGKRKSAKDLVDKSSNLFVYDGTEYFLINE